MSVLPWSSGYKKVSRKTRRGSKRYKMRAHGGHRTYVNKYESNAARDRRVRINALRSDDYEPDYGIADSTDANVDPSSTSVS